MLSDELDGRKVSGRRDRNQAKWMLTVKSFFESVFKGSSLKEEIFDHCSQCDAAEMGLN